jgi:hypothetical protein
MISNEMKNRILDLYMARRNLLHTIRSIKFSLERKMGNLERSKAISQSLIKDPSFETMNQRLS